MKTTRNALTLGMILVATSAAGVVHAGQGSDFMSWNEREDDRSQVYVNVNPYPWMDEVTYSEVKIYSWWDHMDGFNFGENKHSIKVEMRRVGTRTMTWRFRGRTHRIKIRFDQYIEDEFDAPKGTKVSYEGSSGRDLLEEDANDGEFVAYCGAGNDIVVCSGNRCRIYGGAGNDLLIGDTYGESLYGQDGSDFLVGNGGYDFLSTGRGDGQFGGQVDRAYGGINDSNGGFQHNRVDVIEVDPDSADAITDVDGVPTLAELMEFMIDNHGRIHGLAFTQ